MAEPRRPRKAPYPGKSASFGADGLRVPPHSIEAEQSVLGGMMISPEAYDRIEGTLNANDFYRRDHALIFKAIEDLASAGQPFDAVTLGEWFDGRGEQDIVGGGAYIVELASTTPSAANIGAYARIVRDKSMMRRLVDEGVQITELAYNPVEQSAIEVVDEAERRIFAIAETASRNRAAHIEMRPLAREVFKIIQDNYQNQCDLLGPSTGFTDLDRILRGLQQEDLIVLAARPAMGKTALALQIADYVARTANQACAFFSMEMSSKQLGFRLLSLNARIENSSLQRGDLSDEDWPRLTVAMDSMTKSALMIDDTPALSPAELKARARRMAREKNGLGLIVVDYLQLMQVPGNKENRTNEISEISRSLKALAKELKVPVIALSQLNRSLESRADKRPIMSDLRESGAIEQDADIVMFIYRDEYYNADSDDKGLAEIIISKYRNGATGTIKLAFTGRHTRFDNLDADAPWPR